MNLRVGAGMLAVVLLFPPVTGQVVTPRDEESLSMAGG
jgi:hypothetical protein